ncbi:hypothetical protein F3J14_28240 [Burkholderia sp. Tr-862]|uniref:hypothetical protein n=1 Tax=Burkholderia sp. Tr-862 TaxID=2608331 RepID=UPI00141A0EB3|nr:hypothetical protein [Burkholderia sp. Tr-862]NIF44687.1 hypothetical protein [Burkholderia sp. Tr-862]
MAERKNPLDLSGFTPRPAASSSRPAPEVVDQIAAETGFPSRQPLGAPVADTPPTKAVSKATRAKPSDTSPRQDNRRRTGRNVQKNVKLTAQGVADLEAEANRSKETFGEVLERGIAAIRRLREMGVDDYYE